MTRVCLLGDPDLDLQYELLSRETSREALSAYDLERPFENALALRTISVGAAVSLLNDLQWYLTRFVEEAIVQEPSVDESEWLSRKLATRLRNGDVEPEETGEFCKIYGIETGAGDDPAVPAKRTAGAGGEQRFADGDHEAEGGENGDLEAPDPSEGRFAEPTRRLVEPLYARRVDGDVPAYDLRDVEDTLVVRVTKEEFSG